jgi:hypothetical protein
MDISRVEDIVYIGYRDIFIYLFVGSSLPLDELQGLLIKHYGDLVSQQ